MKFICYPKLNYKRSAWNKASFLIFQLQKRLYKSTYIFETKKIWSIQKLLLSSNSARLIAIRDVTQLSSIRKISGVDNKLSLTFLERFELNEYLKKNYMNWVPNMFKKVYFLDKNGLNTEYLVPTISDRAWFFLVNLILQPVHEALFNPRNFGFRLSRSIYEIQNSFFLNLNFSSFGSQKRILKVDIEKNISSFNLALFMNKIIAPRSVKLGIFRSIKKGLILTYSKFFTINLPIINLLFNILFDGIEKLNPSIRYGSLIIFFLKPLDNEKYLVKNLKSFLFNLGLKNMQILIELISSFDGVDFLKWRFKLSNSKSFLCLPTLTNYKSLLFRIKRIINNSNYGSNIKANKLFPIIREWKLYHFIYKFNKILFNFS